MNFLMRIPLLRRFVLHYLARRSLYYHLNISPLPDYSDANAKKVVNE